MIDNLVLACPKCNRAKGGRNPIEWYESQGKNSSHIPRLVMGKMLKLLLAEHGRQGTLFASEYPTGCALKLRNVCAVFTKQFGGNAAKGQSEP